jgi:hypothetical protein
MEDPRLEVLSLEEVPDNSFVIIRVDVAGPMEKYLAANGIIKELNKYRELFSRKKLTIITLTPKEDIGILTEPEMNQIGWFRSTTGPAVLTTPMNVLPS